MNHQTYKHNLFLKVQETFNSINLYDRDKHQGVFTQKDRDNLFYVGLNHARQANPNEDLTNLKIDVVESIQDVLNMKYLKSLNKSCGV